MKKSIKIALIIAVVMSFAWACKKIEVGYLSDYIKYNNPIMTVLAGQNYVSPALDSDGSTLPLKAEIIAFRNKDTGELATDLLTPHPVVVWSKPYDWKVDTIEANLLKKISIVDEPAVQLNEVSGQVRFGVNTLLAKGTKYEFDLRISNVNGTKDFPGIGQVSIPATASNPPVKFNGQTRLRVVDQTTNVILWTFFENLTKLQDGTSTWHTVKKISDESAPGKKDGITVILKVLDKNGVPFSAAKGELKSSWPGSTLPGYEMASVNTQRLDDRIVYHFPVLPFPYYSWYQGDLTYYQIDSKAVGTIDHANFNPTHNYWINFRQDFKIYEAGTFEVVVKFNNVARKVGA